MKKILAAVMAAATFASAISFSAFATDLSLDSTTNPMMNGAFPTNVFASATSASDVAQPESKLYIQIPHAFEDKDLYTVSVKAIEGAKYVKGITRVAKNNLDAVQVANDAFGNTPSAVSGRWDYMQVELKPDYTDAERKVQLEITLKAKSKSLDTGTAKAETVMMYVGNKTVQNDSFTAGDKGMVYKPYKNEENEIVWNDEIRDLARLTFIADSDNAKTYPKLNTKWSESDYRDYFNDQDAFLFEFVGNQYVSSTSRAVLEIYNPYYDADTDEVTVDGEEVIIYQVTEEGLVDVTAQFNYGENEDGDLVFTTKLRQLGTYIFAEAPVDTDDADATDPTEPTVPGDKVPVDTGR